MITHRYGPFESGPDPEGWNVDRLMSILSELLMKHDIALEDALNELISRGLPVNLFLKEGGMDDLLEGFIKELQRRLDDILNRYRLTGALSRTERDVDRDGRTVLEQLQANAKNPRPIPHEERREDVKGNPATSPQQTPHTLIEEFRRLLQERSHDRIFQMKWQIIQGGSVTHRDYNALLKSLEDCNRIEAGMRRYAFTGTEDVDRKTALHLLDMLEQLDELRKNLQTAMQNGDLFQFNLEQLAELLGPESYEEFMERRQRIYDRLSELLEKQGRLVRDEAGQLQLSPDAIRRIGRRALEEIFQHLKSDDTGNLLSSLEESGGEQITPIGRSYEMGDNVSNLDPAASIINAVIRTGQPRPSFRDLEVFRSRGQAKSATAVLLDMSGSMERSDRFYHAKKMVLALDSLIREDYKEDRLIIVGFGTTAQVYRPADLPTMQPFPVTIFDPHIRLRFDLAARALHQKKDADRYAGIPLYFTNLQRGLALCRQLLGGKETKNKQILLITDGVPTAHFEGNRLHINYPPSPADFDFALKEARACTEDGVTINTFLLTPEWGFNFFDERPFVEEFAKQAQGRVFYPHPTKLDHFVLADFIEGKKKLIS